MNTLEKYIFRSPNNTDEECGKFIIDETSRPFILHDIAQAGGQCTFSAWIKSSSPGSISIGGQTFNLTTEWTKCFSTFFPDSEDIEIFFMAAGEYYFYHSKLEIGNKATDWTPAPEDMVDKANIVSCINQTPESITIQANKISLEGLITANSNFKILSDGSMETISGKIGGWSIGNNKIYSENQYNTDVIYGDSDYSYHEYTEGTKSVSLVSDNSNNGEIISVLYEYLTWTSEDTENKTPSTQYVKIFDDGRLKIGTEGIWADDIPFIDTTEISGSYITLIENNQENFTCLITPKDIQFVSSIGSTISLLPTIGYNYYEFPGGLKACWGSVMVTYSNQYVLGKTVSFPFTFTNAPFVTAFITNTNNSYADLFFNLKTSEVSTSSFTLFLHSTQGNFDGSSQKQCNWLAVGY